MAIWEIVSKADPRCRELADRHYTRQSPGFRLFTRPGYNQVLFYSNEIGSAVWVWWRPKWEGGIERKDRLRAIECTLFRNESGTLSSDLIRLAVPMLFYWNRFTYAPDGLITGIGIEQTKKRRSKHAAPGACYIHAGWTTFDHGGRGKAGAWLRYPCPDFRVIYD